MALSEETSGRLHALHDEHTDRLIADVIACNRSMGSPHPERVKLQRLTREEFTFLLENRDHPAGPEVVDRWVRRFTRGHEHEFPGLPFYGEAERN